MNAPAKWLDERRAEAANRFAALGVPHRRIEDWKYSDLKTALDVPALDDAAASWSVGTLPGKASNCSTSSQAGAPDWVHKHFGTLPQNAMASASFARTCAHQGFALRVCPRQDRC